MNTSDQNQTPQTPPPVVQQTVIMMGQNTKSPALAFILALIFGPLGLLYASVTGGIIMLIIDIGVGIVTFGIGLLFMNIVCAVWALSAVNSHNKKASKQQIHHVQQVQHSMQTPSTPPPPPPASPKADNPE